jgi:branched-subunit amino acid ABC-type transport system permease component
MPAGVHRSRCRRHQQPVGAVLGGLIMGLSRHSSALALTANIAMPFRLLLIVILLVRPGGLLGSVATEKV